MGHARFTRGNPIALSHDYILQQEESNTDTTLTRHAALWGGRWWPRRTQRERAGGTLARWERIWSTARPLCRPRMSAELPVGGGGGTFAATQHKKNIRHSLRVFVRWSDRHAKATENFRKRKRNSCRLVPIVSYRALRTEFCITACILFLQVLGGNELKVKTMLSTGLV